MAMTADSSSNHQSPRGNSGGGGGGEGVISPRVRRKHLPSAWAQVVSGELEPAPAANQSQSPPPPQSASPPAPAAAPEHASSSSPPLPSNDVHAVAESSDANSNIAGSGRPKKPAWNKPLLNEGATSATTEIGPLIGDAVSWPELSKSSKPAPRVASSDSSSPSGTFTEGSSSNSQGPAAVSQSARKPVPSANNLNPNRGAHPSAPARPRPNKRGGGGTFHPPPPPVPIIPPPPPPPPPPFPLFQIPPNAIRNNWGSRPNGGFPSQPRAVNEHWNSSRRNNFGSHPRGEGQRDRGNYGSGRDVNAQSHRANLRSYMRSPPPVPNPPAFLHPPPLVRPLMAPVPYTDMGPLYYPAVPMDPFRGPMIYPNGPPVFPYYPPAAEPPLHISLVRQIEFYFSDDNLARDEFLKSNMDSEGWVPISLIANFPRVSYLSAFHEESLGDSLAAQSVKSMTGDTQLILNSLRVSAIVEVQDEKVRRRNEWMRWVRAPGHFSSDGGGSPSSSAASNQSQNTLAASLENMTVSEAPPNESTAGQSEHPDGRNTDNTNPNHGI